MSHNVSLMQWEFLLPSKLTGSKLLILRVKWIARKRKKTYTSLSKQIATRIDVSQCVTCTLQQLPILSFFCFRFRHLNGHKLVLVQCVLVWWRHTHKQSLCMHYFVHNEEYSVSISLRMLKGKIAFNAFQSIVAAIFVVQNSDCTLTRLLQLLDGKAIRSQKLCTSMLVWKKCTFKASRKMALQNCRLWCFLCICNVLDIFLSLTTFSTPQTDIIVIIDY